MTRALHIPRFKLNEHGLARFFGSLEARIMTIVWKHDAVTVHDVCDHLGKGANYKTVMTVMNRLADKGILERKKVSRAFVYTARQSREEFLHDVSRQVVAGLVKEFGQVAVAQFVDVLEELDPGTLQTLQQQIRDRHKPTDRRAAGETRE